MFWNSFTRHIWAFSFKMPKGRKKSIFNIGVKSSVDTYTCKMRACHFATKTYKEFSDHIFLSHFCHDCKSAFVDIEAHLFEKHTTKWYSFFQSFCSQQKTPRNKIMSSNKKQFHRYNKQPLININCKVHGCNFIAKSYIEFKNHLATKHYCHQCECVCVDIDIHELQTHAMEFISPWLITKIKMPKERNLKRRLHPIWVQIH